MALATNSTPGSIVLAGDLTGTANAPQLRITGVIPGSYTAANVIVDDKGRVVRATTGTIGDMAGEATATFSGTDFPNVVIGNVAVTVGSYTKANITVDAKGRVTAAANGSVPSMSGDVSGSTGSNVLANTSVSSGSYVRANITVDAKGRVTAAANGTDPTLGGDVTGLLTSTVLPTTGVTAGSYTRSNITVDAKGRVTAAANGTLAAFAGDVTGAYGSNSLVATGVTAASYTNPSITVDSKGRVTAASNGSAISFSGDLTGPVGSTALAATGVSAGSYTSADITVDAKGRVTAVANGSFLASYTSKGVVQIATSWDNITTSPGAVVNSGIVSLVPARDDGTVTGTVNSADTNNITFTAGAINTGANIPLLNQNNTFGKAVYGVTTALTATDEPLSQVSVDLTTNSYIASYNGAYTAAPTNGVVGDRFSISVNGISAPISGTWNYVGTVDYFTGSAKIADIIFTGNLFVFVASGSNVATPKYIRFYYANSTGSYFTTAGNTNLMTDAYCLGYSGSTLYCAGVYNGVCTKSVANSSTAPVGSWTYTNLGYSILAIAYGSSVWVGRTSGGFGAYSNNGTTWNVLATTIPTSNIVRSSTQFLCVGGTNQVGTSSTGTAWTITTNLPTTAGTWSAVVWTGTQFCAIASGDNICATSPDGTTWTSHTLPATANWTSVSWNGSVFAAVASDLDDQCITSPDGITWSTRKYSGIYAQGKSQQKIVGNNTGQFVAQQLHSSPTAVIPAFNMTFDTKYKFSNTPVGDTFYIDCTVAPNGNVYCTYK